MGAKFQDFILKFLMLTCFKIYLNEAAKQQHTTISACFNNMWYFLFENDFFGFNRLGVLQNGIFPLLLLQNINNFIINKLQRIITSHHHNEDNIIGF